MHLANGDDVVQVHFFTPHQPNYTIRHVKTEKRYLLFQVAKNHYNKILMIYNNILEAMGHTPIIQLQKMVTPDMARVLVKFEGLNVGGSIKTRTAYNMILDAERRGLIDKNSVIVEPTSGNQGIGLALIGAVRGYKTVIIMPDSVSEERRKLVKHYGAEVKLVHDNGDIGKCIQECIDTAFYMQHMDPHVFIPQQFENPANPQIQREQTAAEILEDVNGPIDGFCSGIGTGGTLTGIGEVLRSTIISKNRYGIANRVICSAF